MKNILLQLFITLGSISTMTSCSSDDAGKKVTHPYEQYGTPFTNMPKPNDAVIYQVNLRAFSEAGTLQGVRERLDHIKSLGANVIYLMPLHPVGQVNSVGQMGSPYSVKDYKSIAAEYGSLEDLRLLVSEAHSRDIAVIMDWVANHTSWDNAWITEHPDWYLKNSEGQITSPPGTGWNDVAQLNYDNADMRKAMIDAMSYWVYQANIDGFRCDYADGVPQNFWAEAVQTVRSIKNQPMLMLAEGTRRNHFDIGFDYTFGFRFFDGLKKIYSEGQPASSIQQVNALEYEGVYKANQRVIRYSSNHDVNITDGTPIELFGGKRGSVAAFVVAAYMKSVPMIYNGQEIGYAQRIPFFTQAPIDWSTADADILAEYKKIIGFRKSSEAIRMGAFTGYSNHAVTAFTMNTENETVLVLSNLTNTTVNYIVPPALAGNNWKDAFSGQNVAVGTQITLTPYQYLVLTR